METIDNKTKFKLQPMLPPWADMTFDTELMRKLLDASRRLSRLDGYVSKLADREKFIDAIVYREAKTSCAIDGLRKSERMVKKYREVLLRESRNVAEGNKLSEETLLKIYSELRSGFKDTRPVDEEVLAKTMTFLLHFLNNDYGIPKDPLFRMSLIQYQFEAAQPFRGGDGRAGRLINILYLIQEGLLNQPCLCLSGCYIQHHDTYVESVKSVVSSRNWKQWIMYILNSICCASDYTIDLIRRIQEVQDGIEAAIRENNLQMDRMDPSALLGIPYISPRQLMSGSIKSVNTAKKYLGQLEKLGLLSKTRVGKENVWVNKGLMEILSE